MSAVITTIRAELRRRRLQSFIITLVILLSSGSATLALNLLVESDAPYDHAFAQANGAHLIIMYDASQVGASAVARTAHARGVTAAAGPFLQVSAVLDVTPAGGGPACKGCGAQVQGDFSVVGRDRPDTAVDRLTIESGRWARGPGEIVLQRGFADQWGLSVGDRIGFGESGARTLRVVGIAASIANGGVAAWVTPEQAGAMAAPGAPTRYQMFYRVSSPGTTTELGAAANRIIAGIAKGAVAGVSNYLDAKKQADLLSAVMVPFLLAFSAFALLAAVFIIANIVSGVVIACYRDIGVMKSVGFTPGQVSVVLLGQILSPTVAGCVIGIPLGTLVSQPFLQDTAHALNLPMPFTAAVPVDVGVLAAIVVIAACAAALPCLRAGRLSAASAITLGSAPKAGRNVRIAPWLSRVRMPRAVGLGVAEAGARPTRSLMTMGAVLIGVATTVFALSLHLSLTLVAQHLIRDHYVQVTVDSGAGNRLSLVNPPKGGNGVKGVPLAGGPPPMPSDRQVTASLTANQATARFTAEATDQVHVPGIAEPIPFYGYRGESAWVGFALIQGRWFSGPDEVVAPTKLLAQMHMSVGESFTAQAQGHAVRLHIVGEILDQADDNLLLRGAWSALTALSPGIEPSTYEVALKPGTNPDSYVGQLWRQSGGRIDASTTQRASDNTSFILLNTVIAGLALVLIVVAVAGVFNTVLLTTREKTRDIAILKAIGMEPRQVITMVVSSVALIGLVAGFLGIPAGIELHRQVLSFMGQIASGTGMPPRFLDPINHAVLPLLAGSGVAVAVLGAWIPAHWAAAGRVAEVLQAE